MLSDVILNNVNIVTEDEVFLGSIQLKDGFIKRVNKGKSSIPRSIDCNEDYLIPGLVELHTDNLERHLKPRPGVNWPINNALTAHDGELASAGITTVFDALRVGSINRDGVHRYDKYARETATSINNLSKDKSFKIDHFIHLRAEICSENLIQELEEFNDQDKVKIVSLMDHTPGQRQFRDVSQFKVYLSGKFGLSETQIQQHFSYLKDLQKMFGKKHKIETIKFSKRLNAVLASHDDTTISDVEESCSQGINLAEFPTTLEAATKCKSSNIKIIMGAPNLVRGGSHSGNVSAQSLIDKDLLDILSSDYVPSSLMMAAIMWGIKSNNLPKSIAAVTANPCKVTGLNDRGMIKEGLKAGLVRLSIKKDLPIIRKVWASGREVA